MPQIIGHNVTLDGVRMRSLDLVEIMTPFELRAKVVVFSERGRGAQRQHLEQGSDWLNSLCCYVREYTHEAFTG